MIERLLRHTVASIATAIPAFVGDVFGTVITGVFFVGLGVRAHSLLTGRGARAGRERDARERQMRLTVRRPAEDVPVTTVRELPDDPDPAISMEEV